LRDNIPHGDTEGIPLQFVFEPANCRVFYTAGSVSEPVRLWEQVVAVAWGGGECAWGGMDTVVGNNGSGGNGTATSANGATGLRIGAMSVVIGVSATIALLL
jgi:hypothetical protein